MPTNAIASSTSWRREEPLILEFSWIIATFSNTDSSSIACSVWNVRRTPQRARRKWVIASRSSPNAATLPATGLTNPLSTLKNVVLPAPLGPIRPHVPLSNVTLMLVERRHSAEADRQIGDLDHGSPPPGPRSGP